MRYIGINLGHDGAVALAEDGSLVFSIEAEKDDNECFSSLQPTQISRLTSHLTGNSTVLAYSGWNFKDGLLVDSYFGLKARDLAPSAAGIKRLVSPHERAHIMSSFALSPYPQGEPCYALVWEGSLGRFYYLDAALSITRLADVLMSPGQRYGFIYEIANPMYPDSSRGHSADVAGKLMALAGYAADVTPTSEEELMLRRLLT